VHGDGFCRLLGGFVPSIHLGWQGSGEQVSIVGLPIIIGLLSMFGEIWALAGMDGNKLVCLGVWGVSW